MIPPSMTQYSIVIVAHKFLQWYYSYSSGILIINSYNVILVVVIFLDVLCMSLWAIFENHQSINKPIT